MKTYWYKKNFLDPSHPVAKAYAIPKINYIKKIIDIHRDFKVLDVGAGVGIIMYYLVRIADTIGMDICDHLVDKNPLRSRMQYGNIYHAPFKDKKFDIVISSNLLHHLDDPGLALNEMVRMSRRYIVVIEPNCFNPLTLLYHAIVNEERRALRYNPCTLRNLLRERHLRILSCVGSGMIYQNMTPKFLLPVLKVFDKPFPFGAYCMAIAEKKEK